jgi:calcineurin-like phosphoesterase family protein
MDRETLLAQLQQAVNEDPANREIIAAHAEYLRHSEDKLLTSLRGEEPSPDSPGDIEFGGILYHLNRSPMAAAKEASTPGSLYAELGIPPSQLLSTGAGVEGIGQIVTNDGSLIGFGKWQAFDPDWVEAFGNYILLKLGKIRKASFGTPQAIRISNGKVRIALVGDWGTGAWKDGSSQGPAIDVLRQIAKLNPDYTIHLGDVYYSGTQSEEQSNFVSVMKNAGIGAFMLNSNHEMYDGANGLVNVALPALGQQGASPCFALHNDHVVILGLDSAYDDSSFLFMTGSLSKDGIQASFVRTLIDGKKTVIALTHHNGLSFDGKRTTRLWREMGELLNGRPPDYWYWGHLHNGIVYDDRDDGVRSVRARCAGHGGIPFGTAKSLLDLPTVKYFSNTPNPQAPPRVMNGFAMLEIDGATIKETFYDQTGAVAWSSDEQEVPMFLTSSPQSFPPPPPVQTTGQPAPVPSTTAGSLREWVTAILAVLIVVGAMFAIGAVLKNIDDDTKFKNAKDILLLVNPLLGLVIGFYFTKNAVEGRAEHAEASAKQALDTAKSAETARTAAKEDSEQKGAVLREVANFLREGGSGPVAIARAATTAADRVNVLLDRIQRVL